MVLLHCKAFYWLWDCYKINSKLILSTATSGYQQRLINTTFFVLYKISWKCCWSSIRWSWPYVPNNLEIRDWEDKLRSTSSSDSSSQASISFRSSLYFSQGQDQIGFSMQHIASWALVLSDCLQSSRKGTWIRLVQLGGIPPSVICNSAAFWTTLSEKWLDAASHIKPSFSLG